MAELVPADERVVRRSALLRGLPAGELEAVLAAALPRRFARGAMVIRQGEPARTQHVILAGRLRVTQVAGDGREVLLRFLGPGQTVGGVAALGDLVCSGSAVAVEATRTLAWGSEAFAGLLERCPRLARNTMGLMAERIQELQARCAELMTERVDRRVAHALLRLTRAGESGAALRLSRQDLAEMTGTSLFTVSRVLSRWAHDGVIVAGRQRVVVRDVARLAAIAEDAPG